MKQERKCEEKYRQKSIERNEIIEAYIFLYMNRFSYRLVYSITYHIDYNRRKHNLYS